MHTANDACWQLTIFDGLEGVGLEVKVVDGQSLYVKVMFTLRFGNTRH